MVKIKDYRRINAWLVLAIKSLMEKEYKKRTIEIYGNEIKYFLESIHPKDPTEIKQSATQKYLDKIREKSYVRATKITKPALLYFFNKVVIPFSQQET